MSTSRIFTASSFVDRDVAVHVHLADLAVRAALQRLEREKHATGNNAYLARVRRDLEKCLGALSNVRRVHPHGPPEILSEPVKAPPPTVSLATTETDE